METESILQSVFDKACAGVVAQGCHSLLARSGASSYGSSACAYRGLNGNKCAIGHLLTDEQIKKYQVVEGSSPEQFPRDLIDELVPGIYNGWALQFLNDLQDAHDSVDPNENFVNTFKYKANLVAEKWNLKALV